LYSLEIEEVFKAFKKLAEKDKQQLEALNKKNNPSFLRKKQNQPLRNQKW
jgi:hypothetical protein